MSRLLTAAAALGTFYLAFRSFEVDALFGVVFLLLALGLWSFAVRGEEREWRAF